MSFYVTTSGHLTYKYAGEEYTIDSSELAGGSWEVSASPQFKEDDTEYSSRYTAGTRHGTFAWTVTMSVGVSGSSISDWWPEYPI
ncbi:hypothetical protein, partial [Pseudomonas sp.]|uniref:hypothetical protein n=1 Tax=Pseudomonas sp. TaxID=306 RepID=UPI0028AAC337